MPHPIPRVILLAPLLLAAGCARLFPGVDVGSAPTAPPPVTPSVGNAPIAPTDAAPPSTPWPEGDVARLLADPPAAGEGVELDVYTSYVPGIPGWSSEPRVGAASGNPCQDSMENRLTDRPLPSWYSFGNLSQIGNPLPREAAYLVAAAPPSTAYPPPSSALPFHARVRGHLGEASYAGCPDAARIFVIDELVRDYGDPLPGSSDEQAAPLEADGWPRFDSPQSDFSFAYPPDWQVHEEPEGVLSLVVPNRPDVTVRFKTRAGETTSLNPTDPWLGLPPLGSNGMGGGLGAGTGGQDDTSPYDVAGVAPLSGIQATCDGPPRACIREILNHDGQSYQFAIDFPTGFEVPQVDLWRFTAMVNSFRVRNQPTKTPAPPETGTPAPPGQS